jgi:acyl-CoA-associated DUF35 OB-fold domain-containing protein
MREASRGESAEFLKDRQQNSNDAPGARRHTSALRWHPAPLKETPLKISQRTQPCFRDSPRGMVLVATRTAGHDPQFPPVEFLHGGEQAEEVELGPTGRLYSYSIVHAGKDQAPYGLAMVDFEPGVRAFGRLLFQGRPPAIDSTLRIVPFAMPDGTPDYAFQAE